MVKEGSTTAGAFWRDLFSLGFYKRSQGRIARQVTFIVLAIAVALGGWSLLNYMRDKALPFTGWMLVDTSGITDMTPDLQETVNSRRALYDTINGYARYLLPMAFVFSGWWMAFRAVNVPRFADFLIAVEAEMNKVSWPTRREMLRSSVVVMITIFGMAAVLFAYDFVWQALLQMIGVVPSGGGG